MLDVVRKLWGYCDILRHDGVDYGDYIEQLAYLLFIKMAEERSVPLPKAAQWEHLQSADSKQLLRIYDDALAIMGRHSGVLGQIFEGAESRIHSANSLQRLLNLLDDVSWSELGVDVQAAVFEGLLERAAAEGKKGAGQYFTPRPLVDAVTACLQPDPRNAADFTIADPACGTGGFLAAAWNWLTPRLGTDVDPETTRRLQTRTYFGVDLVARPRRLALMNMFLHGISADIQLADSIYENPTPRRFDVVLTNPPFGSRGANGVPYRRDFMVATSNKQLNFIQHVHTILKPGGRAAVVVPDNVLFSVQARDLLDLLAKECRIHTVLRGPNGTFNPYTDGTKTNVLFFTRGEPTDVIWIYDARTNLPKVSRTQPLTHHHFAEFEFCYGPQPNGDGRRDETDSSSGRWRSFTIEEVRALGFRLDSLRWLAQPEDHSVAIEPAALLTEAISTLEGAGKELHHLRTLLERGWGHE
jgi:type I restriction enzyme M protein